MPMCVSLAERSNVEGLFGETSKGVVKIIAVDGNGERHCMEWRRPFELRYSPKLEVSWVPNADTASLIASQNIRLNLEADQADHAGPFADGPDDILKD